MVCTPNVHDASAVPESRKPGGLAGAEAGDERKTSAVPGQRGRRQGRLDAGPFTADVASFRLHLAAENKAPGTIRVYTEAPLWFAAAHLLRETEKSRWEQVDAQDVQRWVARFRHHFSHTWLDRGGAEGDLMELNGWTSPQMLRRYGASARSARARRSYDRIMEEAP